VLKRQSCADVQHSTRHTIGQCLLSVVVVLCWGALGDKSMCAVCRWHCVPQWCAPGGAEAPLAAADIPGNHTHEGETGHSCRGTGAQHQGHSHMQLHPPQWNTWSSSGYWESLRGRKTTSCNTHMAVAGAVQAYCHPGAGGCPKLCAVVLCAMQ
jgi:hypothetical protein